MNRYESFESISLIFKMIFYFFTRASIMWLPQILIISFCVVFDTYVIFLDKICK